MAQLTRPQMEAIIRGGGSVSIAGRVISRVQDLPSAVQLAGSDPEKLAQTTEDIEGQIKALQKQLKEAQAAAKKADAEAAKTGDGTGETGQQAPT